jgi:hypothetical protein
MNRFFFHLASKDNTIWDEKGRDFTDLAAAHRHAMLLIHKMVALDDVDWAGWSINVTDASYGSVLSVLFPPTYCRPARQTSHSSYNGDAVEIDCKPCHN